MENRFTKASGFFRNISRKVSLFKDKWIEKTTALLRITPDDHCAAALTDIITSATADSRRLLYVNTEHRAETLDPALADNDRLLIFTPAYDSPDDPSDYADLVISGIEQAVATTDIRTFIVDSVSRIAALSFGRNASPSYVMKRLVSLQMRHGLSILIVSRPASRSVERALSCLADSTFTPDTTEPSSPTCATESRFSTCADRKAGFYPAPHQPDAQRPESRFSTCADIKLTPSKTDYMQNLNESASEMRHPQPDAQLASRENQTSSDSKTPTPVSKTPETPKTEATKTPSKSINNSPLLYDFLFDEGRAWTAPDLYSAL